MREADKLNIRCYVAGVSLVVVLAIVGFSIFAVLDWKIAGLEVCIVWLFLCFVLSAFPLRRVLRRSFERRYKQSQADRNAQASILSKTGQGEFFLYLRSFNTTSRLPVTVRASGRFTANSHVPDEADTIDLEIQLARALEFRAPLVALDPRPDAAVGAGRIVVDDAHWESAFTDLASRAIAIFVVPGTTTSIQLELRCLRENRLLRRKTILVIPPLPVDPFGNPLGSSGMPRSKLAEKGPPPHILSLQEEPKPDYIEALAGLGLIVDVEDCRRGLLIQYNSPRTVRVPIVDYSSRVRSDGRGGTQTVVLEQGFRRAVLAIRPDLLGR